MKIKIPKSKTITHVKSEKFTKKQEKIPLFAKKFMEQSSIASNELIDIFMSKFVFDNAIIKAQTKIRNNMEQEHIMLLDEIGQKTIDNDFDIFIRVGLLKIIIKKILNVTDSEAIDLALNYVLKSPTKPTSTKPQLSKPKQGTEDVVGIIKNLLANRDKESPFLTKEKNGQK